MKVDDRRRMSVNRRKWDESVPLHVASRAYDVPSFLRGQSTLLPIEIRGMGSVRGKTLLHLQCHFGMDTLSWARRGARVTGLDFSLPALRTARRLARQVGLQARFVESNVFDAREALHERFDFVYTGKGAMCWLPEVDPWAEVVARSLNPGGRLYLLEDHPFAEIFPNGPSVTHLEVKEQYFGSRALREEFDGTYATTERMKHKVSYSWIHPVSDTLSALARHGLEILSVREYPYSYWRRYSFMAQDRHGYWHLTRQAGVVPLMWSVTARRPPRRGT